MLNEGHRRRERGTDVVVGFVETHGRPGRPSRSAISRSCPVAHRASRQRRSPRWMSTRSCAAGRSGAGRRARAHQRPGSRTRSGGKTSRRSSRRHRRHLNRQHPAPRVAERRRRTNHRDPPAGDHARSRRPGRRADRARRHGARGAPDDWPTATSTARRRSTPRSPTTSGRATCRRCVNWPCSGSPTASTTRSHEYRDRTASPGRGRPTSGSSSPWPVRPTRITSCAGPLASPSEPRASHRRPRRWPTPASRPATTRQRSGCRRPAPARRGARGRIPRINGNDVAGGAGRPGAIRERHPDRPRRDRPFALAGAVQRLR